MPRHSHCAFCACHDLRDNDLRPNFLHLGISHRERMSKKTRRALDAAIHSANLTVKSMASALGVSQSALRRYRRGSRPVPPKLLKAVASLLRYQAERLTLKAALLDSIAIQTAKREE